MRLAIFIAVDILLFALVLYRQIRVRPLGSGRLSVALTVLGLLELWNYGQSHPMTGPGWIFIIASMIAAVLLGGLRALTVRLWREGPQVLRQGTWLTVLLWLVSLGGHVLTGALLRGSVASAAVAATMLFLGVTLGAQYVVLLGRARSRLAIPPPLGAADQPLPPR
jgi:hypothetical protein